MGLVTPRAVGPLNSIFFFSRGLGRRMLLGVEVTESSTNKQHHLSMQAVQDSMERAGYPAHSWGVGFCD